MSDSEVFRCFGDKDPLSMRYHDEEWGVPEHEDKALFELIVLEGAQAGLSWRTILHRREGYRRAFQGFDPPGVARDTPRENDEVLPGPGVLRDRGRRRGHARIIHRRG
ncbi:DNA-3-methyladenine glycosylase I, partial [Candidatus Bathyarchaeota archaeon]|nr:DNA-3-methyladenine glycosylase I [Candidatus Bathyarchaeota archaeon]